NSSLLKLFAILCVVFALRDGWSQNLYNINFNNQSPETTVKTGQGSSRVSEVVFGTPKVAASFGGLSDQPLVFDMAENRSPFYYDQIQLNLPHSSLSSLEVDFDFTSSALIGSPAQFT